jgi:hypothetical protein
MSIFQEYYGEHQFTDRLIQTSEEGVEVIIPVFHTNELWRINLISIFREIPVKRLLISDGGCIDDSIEVVKQFPRVEIYNHRHFKSLGKCIAELIKNVESEWFIYLHSDVYLPKGWYDQMIKYQDRYDWYGCPMNITALINYRLEEPLRPYAGSQMGRKAAFKDVDRIDDDYVYRQEDFVFNRIVEDAGYTTGKVEDTFHYHQLMFRKSAGFDVNVKKLNLVTHNNEWEVQRALDMQIRGIVKYLDPKEPYMIMDFNSKVFELVYADTSKLKELKNWIRETNPKWQAYLGWKFMAKLNYRRLRSKLGALKNRLSH